MSPVIEYCPVSPVAPPNRITLLRLIAVIVWPKRARGELPDASRELISLDSSSSLRFIFIKTDIGLQRTYARRVKALRMGFRVGLCEQWGGVKRHIAEARWVMWVLSEWIALLRDLFRPSRELLGGIMPFALEFVAGGCAFSQFLGFLIFVYRIAVSALIVLLRSRLPVLVVYLCILRQL